MHQQLTVDVAIIGSGSAGLAAWRAASKQGKKVVIIESGPVGPSKRDDSCINSA